MYNIHGRNISAGYYKIGNITLTYLDMFIYL